MAPTGHTGMQVLQATHRFVEIFMVVRVYMIEWTATRLLPITGKAL